MNMVRAIWNDRTIAESDETVYVEGNHYFSRDSVDTSVFRDSETTSYCPWKGTANYYSITIGGDEIKDAAWYYAQPKEGAQHISDRIAFWRGIRVVDLSQAAQAEDQPRTASL